jgi:ATP-dependent protease ClpP protease subunit
MKHHSIIGRIDAESYNSLINFLNESQGEQKSILINSGGGEIAYCYATLHAIEKVSHEIELVGCNGVYSAAFEIFYKFSGKKVLLPYCKGMTHRPMLGVSLTDSLQTAFREDDCQKRTLKDNQQNLIDECSKFLTPKEMKDYKRGVDVYFTYNRMKEIFNLS